MLAVSELTLSSGEIAVIVAAVLLVAAGLAVVVIYYRRKIAELQTGKYYGESHFSVLPLPLRLTPSPCSSKLSGKR